MSTYYIALMIESTGDFEIIDDFEAENDAEANDYAANKYHTDDWYLLDSDKNNINAW